MERSARLMVVGTDRIFRECLTMALDRSGSFAVVDHADDFESAERRIIGNRLDVLLVDLSFFSENSLQGALRLIQELDGVKVLLLGVNHIEREILSFVEAGASGYVSSQTSLEELNNAVESVLKGEVVCSPGVTFSMFNRLAELSREQRQNERLESLRLTSREIEILELISGNMTNKDISSRLGLSVHTVKNHVHNILKKLRVGSRGAAVEYAVEMGWLEEPWHA